MLMKQKKKKQRHVENLFRHLSHYSIDKQQMFEAFLSVFIPARHSRVTRYAVLQDGNRFHMDLSHRW